jgi:hypothetical protein
MNATAALTTYRRSRDYANRVIAAFAIRALLRKSPWSAL